MLIFTSENFEKEVLQSDKPVLVDFFATWCGPCRMVAPVIDEIATEKAGQVAVYKVDIDQSPDLAFKKILRSDRSILMSTRNW